MSLGKGLWKTESDTAKRVRKSLDCQTVGCNLPNIVHLERTLQSINAFLGRRIPIFDVLHRIIKMGESSFVLEEHASQSLHRNGVPCNSGILEPANES